MRDDTSRLSHALESLGELGPALTSNTDFRETAGKILAMVMKIAGSRSGVLFQFGEKPLMLRSLAAAGFSKFPEDATVPLLPRHGYALGRLHEPARLDGKGREQFFSKDGNFNPAWLEWIIPLRVGRKLVAILGLGEHLEGADYDPEEVHSVQVVGHYCALAVHNHSMSETLAARISENLKLLSSVHAFYDSTLEVLAAAIDIKDINIHGHSMRVGAYGAAIAHTLGMSENEIAGVRAAGFLHDIGKVAVDRYLFNKADPLDPSEFRQLADHTVLGYDIVKDVEFPWASIPEVVRSHHERADGTGYPDGLLLTDMRPEVKIVALADTFEAMTSERPYRRSMSVGEALTAIVNLTPSKLDPESVQALIVQVRRDAVATLIPPPGSGTEPSIQRPRFLRDGLTCNLFPSDIDQIASLLNHKLTQGRTYLDMIH
jgi:putative nucleotidyltransferase with HDIG domain